MKEKWKENTNQTEQSEGNLTVYFKSFPLVVCQNNSEVRFNSMHFFEHCNVLDEYIRIWYIIFIGRLTQMPVPLMKICNLVFET